MRGDIDTVAKVFISFYNAVLDVNDKHAMPCFFESFIKGLEEKGNSTLVYSHNDPIKMEGFIPKELLTSIKCFDPDVIILFNNCFYDISDQFDCPIVIYEVDSVLYYSNKDKIAKNPNRYYYFVPQTDSIQILNDTLNVDKKNILYVPFFTSIEADTSAKTIPISFIGSKFTNTNETKSCWEEFQKLKPSYDEIEQFKTILLAINSDPFIELNQIRDRYKNFSSNVMNNIDLNSIIWQLSDSKRVQLLSDVADLGLELYGTENWGTDLPLNPEVSLSFNPRNIFSLAHNQEIYNSSKICLNINHIQAKSGFSWRVCDIMASSGCLVSEYRPDFDLLFPNVPLPTFTNKFEAREKCLYLLKEENLRADIVSQCQEIINKNHRFNNLIKEIENFLDIPMCSDFGENDLYNGSNIILEPKKIDKKTQGSEIKLFFYCFLLLFSKVPVFSKSINVKKLLNRIKRRVDALVN